MYILDQYILNKYVPVSFAYAWHRHTRMYVCLRSSSIVRKMISFGLYFACYSSLIKIHWVFLQHFFMHLTQVYEPVIEILEHHHHRHQLACFAFGLVGDSLLIRAFFWFCLQLCFYFFNWSLVNNHIYSAQFNPSYSLLLPSCI